MKLHFIDHILIFLEKKMLGNKYLPEYENSLGDLCVLSYWTTYMGSSVNY